MNILRVINSMDPASGGPCQGIRNSIPALEKLGLKNEVLCMDAPGSAFLTSDPFPVHALGNGKTPYRYHAGWRDWLMQHLSRFDVVIIHGLWLYSSYGTYAAWKIFRQQRARAPKLYVMPHGMLDPYFQRAKGRRLKAIRNWFFWKLMESKVVNGADGLLFTCEQELLLARQAFLPYQPRRECNIGYGIQPPPRQKAGMQEAFFKACPEVNGKRYLLFLSRIHPKKGVDLLIGAYLDLKSTEIPLPDLVMAGPGMDTGFGQGLYALSGGDRQLHFVGMLEGDAKWGAFYHCDAFVLPSHQENFGIAVVEALACGKAVLLTDQVNIWREIADEGAGLIAKDNQEGVKHALLRWMQLPESEQQLMGSRARRAYERHFAIEQAALNMKAAFEGMVDRSL